MMEVPGKPFSRKFLSAVMTAASRGAVLAVVRVARLRSALAGVAFAATAPLVGFALHWALSLWTLSNAVSVATYDTCLTVDCGQNTMDI